MTTFDDGNAPMLFIGGAFYGGIVKWNGHQNFSVGGGTNSGGFVSAMTVFDDGAGSVLYAAGGFYRCLALYAAGDRHGGSMLIAGGSFANAGSLAVNSIAQWNGSTWSALGRGGSVQARSMVVHDDDGPGPNFSALFVAGVNTAGGQNYGGLAKWTGMEWLPVGLSGTYSSIQSLCVFDDDGPLGAHLPSLIAAGNFASIGGINANNIARWDGAAWTPLGSGTANYGYIYCALVFDEDGSGPNPPRLFVGGQFAAAGGVTVNNIARFDGTNWTARGTGIPGGNPTTVTAITVFDDGSGPALYVGGTFSSAGGVPARNIARWTPGSPGSWSALGAGVVATSIYTPAVAAMAGFDEDGVIGPNPPRLFVAGRFTNAGAVAAVNVARWTPTGPGTGTWSAAGAGLSAPSGTESYPAVNALLAYDEDGPGGSDPQLYAAGQFNVSGALPVNRIARWNGAGWSALGGGIGNASIPASSEAGYSLAAFADGEYGEAFASLYVGGSFGTANGGLAATGFARRLATAYSPALIQSPANRAARLGDCVTLEAQAIGAQPIMCRWLRNGAALMESSRITGVGSSRLVIKYATLGDAGYYYVTFMSPCGTISSSAGLLVVNCLGPATGDLNGDGAADGADIQLLVNAIATGAAPDGPICRGDFDHTLSLDPGDVSGFIQAVLGN